MTATIGANGELFPYPEAGETGWGPDGTNWAIAVSQALTKLGLGGSTTPKAILNIVTTTAGILVPRMTTAQRDVMFPVPDSSYRGLMIYNLDADFYQIYDGTAWISPTSIMAMTANTVPVADGTGNALVNSPMTVAGTKVTQAGAMDITGNLAVTGVGSFSGGASMGSQKITSLLAGTVGTDAVNKDQMDAANGYWFASGTAPSLSSVSFVPPVANQKYAIILHIKTTATYSVFTFGGTILNSNTVTVSDGDLRMIVYESDNSGAGITINAGVGSNAICALMGVMVK